MIHRALLGAALLSAALFHHAHVSRALHDPENARTLPFADELAGWGEGARHKSLDHESRVWLARTLVAECARCSREEVQALAFVVFNRMRDGRHGSDVASVVLHSRGTVWAFSAWDPRARYYAARPDILRTKAYSRALVWADEAWQLHRSGVDSTNGARCYYHPESMIPLGRVPKWAIGKPQTRIGGAQIVHCA